MAVDLITERRKLSVSRLLFVSIAKASAISVS